MFIRAHSAAFIATALDFTVYTILINLLGVWYVIAAVLSAISGAICSFLLGRHWCFVASDGHLTTQGIRYALVASGSLILNTSGIYFLTDVMNVHYMLSKVLIALAVANLFNFPLHRYYVFSK